MNPYDATNGMEKPFIVSVDNVENYDTYGDGENSSDDNKSMSSTNSLGRSHYEKAKSPSKAAIPQSLESISWFHKGMSRNTAEAILLKNAYEGSYLLRDSSANPGNYTVSVRYSKSIKHFTLTSDGSIYKFGIGTFYSLEELLDHFASLPVLGTESGGTATLRYPYYNNVLEPSSYQVIVRHAEGKGAFSSMKQNFDDTPPDYHIASKEGYLAKLGAFRKNWKRRWFVLNKNELMYFKSREKKKPIRIINLANGLDVSEEELPGKRNCFNLQLPWRTFHFYAGTAQDANEWMEILKWKLDYYKERNANASSKDPLASMAR